jgi:PAS domain S-box-containing protein
VRTDLGNEPLSVARSVTELERFFDLALDLMIIAGFDGYYKRVNPAFVRTIGYSLRELMSRPFIEFIHPDDVQRTLDEFAELLAGGSDLIGFEARFRCADGSVRWFQWNTSTVPERGIIYGVGRDVTDRRAADARLREAHRMLEASRAELVASRARIVAATDQERRRVIRDLHDGAQQRLVHTVITMKLACRALDSGDDARPLVTQALDQAEQATAELRELAHGILPAVLTRGGLRAGVDALASRMPVPVENGVSVGRLPTGIEATAYFVVAEALTNVAKHSRAQRARVSARVEEGALRIEVRDDGLGGARPDGSGLVGVSDRIAALDGRFQVDSPAGGGTLVAADIPIPS